MSNQVEKVNGIAIADIAKINGETDDDIAKLNGEEFTGVTDAHTFISSQTASGSSSLSFTSGIDSTYDVYEWHFINMHPASIGFFEFQVNAAGGSGFNETMTTTQFMAMHDEVDAYTYLRYETGDDQAQGTGYQHLANNTHNDSDSHCSGILTLFAPSSTTYVKHFTAVMQNNYNSGSLARSQNLFIAGYINTTSAIDEIDFKFDSGNIDAGEIRMYGVATS